MKLVAISDIHSNYIALQSALKMVDEIKADGIVFLGDYVSDCPYPQNTMALLFDYKNKYNCYFVRGNREEYFINYRKNSDKNWFYNSSTGSLLYTYENLTDTDLDFFESMPICYDIDIKGCPVITICHGSPENTREEIKGKDILLDKYTKTIKGEILLCGHTHRSDVYHFNDKEVIFCPSVGLPQDRNSNVRILVLDCVDSVWEYEMLEIPCDNETLISKFFESGLIEKAPIWSRCIIKSIREQRDYPFQCLVLAWEKAQIESHIKNREIPEKYWFEAAQELGII